MRVTVEYATQVKRAAGVASESVTIEAPYTLGELISRITTEHGEPLADLLLGDGGGLSPSILLFVGDTQIREGLATELHENDVITVLSPISGG
jgi:molybdopterin converting factor small subunit